MAVNAANAYSVYRSLSLGGASTPAAQRMLNALKAAAGQNGGVLTRDTLPLIDDPVARKVAALALRNRSAANALPRPDEQPRGWKKDADGWQRDDGVGFSKRNPRDSWLAMLVDYHRGLTAPESSPGPVQLKLDELTPAWFAAYFTFLLMVEGGSKMNLSDMLRPMVPDIVRFMEVQGQVDRARDASHDATVFEPLLQRAREKLVLAPQALLATGPVLAQGAQKLGADAVEVLATVTMTTDVLDEPGAQDQLLELLAHERLDGIRISSADAMRESAGPMPVLYGLVERLKARGLLDKNTFKNVELFVRTHGLPSTAELVKVMIEYGGLRAVSGKFKGVSTAPLAVAAAERVMKVLDPGFGDAKLQGEDGQSLVAEISASFQSAQQAGRAAMVLGDGRETVRAAAEAQAQNPGVKVGYVELTQSGVNELRSMKALPFDVTALAETALKKLGESELLGEWLVDRLVEVAARGELPDPLTERVAVIGQGDVGGGVALGLQKEGATGLLTADRSDDALERANGRGFPTAQWQTGQPLPEADIYILATGGAATIDEAALRSMPDGAHVVNYASRGELDEAFLERVARGEVPGARIFVEHGNPLPEHETLVLELDGKRLHLHKRGQPYFDGRKDKDPMLVDLYMAGLLASLAVEARALKSAPYDSPELKGLDVSLQREVFALLEEHYPQEKYRALLQQLEAALGQ